MKKVIPKRAKPTVADVNASTALANIKEKLRVLEQLSESEADVVSQAPKSTRAFLLWTSEGADFPEGVGGNFGRTSRETLVKHAALARLVRELTKKCSVASRGEAKISNRAERVSNLQRSKSIANLLRQIAERELTSVRRDWIRINNARAQAEAQLLSFRAVMFDRLSSLEAEVQELREANAKLVALTRKLVPLKRAKE
jgi:hypothetical protein